LQEPEKAAVSRGRREIWDGLFVPKAAFSEGALQNSVLQRALLMDKPVLAALGGSDRRGGFSRRVFLVRRCKEPPDLLNGAFNQLADAQIGHAHDHVLTVVDGD
jgi:hypothetical protein